MDIIDSSGRKFKSLREASRYHNKIFETVYSRIRQGWSVADALEKPINASKKCLYEPYTDSKGIEFNSAVEAAKHYGVCEGTLRGRLNSGFSLKEAVETSVGERTNKRERYIDSSGIEYETIKKACEAYGISTHTVVGRMHKGWSFIDALETLPYARDKVEKPVVATREKIVDSKGNVFNSVKEGCGHYNISYSTVIKRMQKGMSAEEAIETPVGQVAKRARTEYIDSKGNEFRSLSDAFKYWHISASTVNSRIKKGMSLREAIETPSHKDKGKTVRLSNGMEFSSQKDALNFYNISRQAMHIRMKKHNQSFEQALNEFIAKKSEKIEKSHNEGIKQDARCVKYVDSQGAEFKNLRDAYKHYGVTPNKVRSRIKSGWRLVDAIETPKDRQIEHNVKMYYKIKDLYPRQNVSNDTILKRLRCGWSFDKALDTPE